MENFTIGFIPAHRDLMDEEFAESMRDYYIEKLNSIEFVEIIAPDKNLTAGGLVRNDNDARKVINLFSAFKLDAIIIGALTYGDERSALSIVENYTNTPIFLFAAAEPEIPKDKFFKSAAPCGMLPISFGLNRRDLSFTFGGIFKKDDEKFELKFDLFLRTVSALKKFRNARIGMIGSRPNDFELCAADETLMINKFRQKIVHINLLDLKYDMEAINEKDPLVNKITEDMTQGLNCAYSQEELIQSAKLEYQILKYAEEYNLDAFTIQCWSSIQKYIGVTPCMVSGRVTNQGFPVACEGDVNGALSMLMQMGISMKKETPFLLDILTAHPFEDNLILAWHCGNISAVNCSSEEIPKVMPQCPWENIFGKKAAAASIEFVFKEGVITFNSLVQQKQRFQISNFIGKAVKRDDEIRGAWSWVEVADREKLYEMLVYKGFPHHASICHGDYSESVKEFCKYAGIDCIGV